MELNSSVLNTLKALSGSLDNQSNGFSDEGFSILIKAVFESFLINKKTGQFDLNLDKQIIENLGRTSAELKDAVAALYTLISESAKCDLDINSLSTFLEDNGFTSERIKTFREHYEDKISIIRIFLLTSSFSYPHIVDVNWRLDYCIKENNLERINEPIYLIELKVEKPNQDSLSSLNFSCSIEQLQDFIHKLKEATKSLEKLAQLQ